MNITIFIGGLSGGGAERVVCNLSNYLSRSHSVTILTMSDDKPISKINTGIKRFSLLKKQEQSNFFIRNLKRYFRFRKFIKKSNADIYIVMLPKTINFMLLNRKLIKVPIIVSERADPKTRYEKSKFKRWVMQKLYPKADGFVFQTQSAMDYYSNIVSDNAIVIPNAINPEFIRNPYTGKRKKVIVSAGRFTEQKNFQMLISAFSEINKYHENYKLIIYGDGPLRESLEKQVAKLELNDRVILPGYVEDIASRILDASLFVLPSNYEGMPNVLMEAMALGLPCISTNCPVGGPEFLIKHGENGLLVPVNDTDKLVDAMDTVLSNQKFAKKIGDEAINITKKLNPEKVYKKWDEFLRLYQV